MNIIFGNLFDVEEDVDLFDLSFDNNVFGESGITGEYTEIFPDKIVGKWIENGQFRTEILIQRGN